MSSRLALSSRSHVRWLGISNPKCFALVTEVREYEPHEAVMHLPIVIHRMLLSHPQLQILGCLSLISLGCLSLISYFSCLSCSYLIFLLNFYCAFCFNARAEGQVHIPATWATSKDQFFLLVWKGGYGYNPFSSELNFKLRFWVRGLWLCSIYANICRTNFDPGIGSLEKQIIFLLQMLWIISTSHTILQFRRVVFFQLNVNKRITFSTCM